MIRSANSRRAQFHLALGLTAAMTAAISVGEGKHPAETASSPAARIRHVFVIVLENKNFSDTFETSPQDPYLRKTLVPAGAVLTHYYGTGHVSLDNYISMISGQAPTPDTANDCVTDFGASVGNYTDVVEVGTTADGQTIATSGCIYPAHVKTLVNQLTDAGYTWKAYMEDMGNDPARESATCGHPRFGVGTDDTNAAEAPSAAIPQGDAYATRHNPFMYFHSIIDSPLCRYKVVNLGHLTADLSRDSTTANLIFITPNLCHDGHDGNGTGKAGTTCDNGEPGGLTSADAFLRSWVPRILSSPAYKADGLLIVTFDESDYTIIESREAATGRTVRDITFPGEACCNQQPGPNLSRARPGKTVVTDTAELLQRLDVKGYGGDRIGALLLSPFIVHGSSSAIAYNHYSLLRTLEEIFRLRAHLGYAADNAASGYHVDSITDDPGIFQHGRAADTAR